MNGRMKSKTGIAGVILIIAIGLLFVMRLKTDTEYGLPSGYGDEQKNMGEEKERKLAEEFLNEVERAAENASEEEAEDIQDAASFIDYDYIEKYHKILIHNICDSPKDDYSDTVLADYLKEDIEKDKELLESGLGEEHPLTIEYYLFDFNEDGLEDYLVCLQGTFWSQDGKNTVRIYTQEQNGILWEAFEDYIYCYKLDYYASVAVLSERVEGYHSLALLKENSLLRYDGEKRQYEFCEIASHAEEEFTEDEIHVGITEEEYAEKKERYENMKHSDMIIFIDYEFIEAKHEILRHNICITPQDANDNAVLKEYLKDDMEDDRQSQQMFEKMNEGWVPLYIDYFPFDFNEDGLEDYLVCYHGGGWTGSGGNYVCICIQESDGSLSKLFSVTMRLHDHNLQPYGHSSIAILDEKDDGYYAFVLGGSNRIIRYDKESGRYEFEDR